MKRMVKLFLPVLCLSLILAMSAGAAVTPTEQVKVEVDHILDLLKDKKIDSASRIEQIDNLIRNRFDFQTMSQWILGINWRKATPEQQNRFVDLFTQLLETTYRGRIEAYVQEYTDEHVKYVGEQVRKGKALVETLVVTKSAEIPINYKLLLETDEWRVYDVVIEKVSLISNYRSTYDEIVRKEGFEGLFNRMEKKIEALKNGADPKEVKP